MRILKIIAALVGVLAVLMLAFIGRLRWESQHPTLPKGWPSGSVWLEAPRTWPGVLLVGYWVGCSLDTKRNVDTCRFADFKGKIVHEDDYTTCDDKPPIPDWGLWLRPGHQSFGSIF